MPSSRIFVVTLLWLACAWPALAVPVLRVLSWPGYADADVVARFEAEHKVRVEISLVESDDQLWQRMTDDSGGRFDLLAANTAELQRYLAAGLLHPIDLQRINNRKHQLERFRQLEQIPGASRSGISYAIPFTYAHMGLIYDRQAISVAPTSWRVLWDSRYRGKVLAYDGSSHAFSLAALSLGRDPFNISDADFPLLARELVALRRNVLTFYTSPEQVVDAFRRNGAQLAFANYGSQQVKWLQDAGVDVGYVIPQEGALAWLDCWAISRTTRDAALAHAWINFMLEPEVSREFSRRQGLANTLEVPAGGTTSEEPLIWLSMVESTQRRAGLWARILSGDRLERF